MKKYFIIILLFFFGISYADDIKIVTKEIKDSSVQYRYYASGKYPQIEGMKDLNIQKKINEEIFEKMKKGIDDFKKDTKELNLNDIPKEFYNDIEYSYTLYTITDEIFSFAFDVYSFYAGAAHPNYWTVSMNYDLKNGKLIEFKDLFKKGEKYLERISKYCIDDLKLQVRFNRYEPFEDMIKSGAGPNESNFKNFNLLQKGLQISFDPYQVAPYVYGPQYVFISYRTLYELLDDEGVISKFVSQFL